MSEYLETWDCFHMTMQVNTVMAGIQWTLGNVDIVDAFIEDYKLAYIAQYKPPLGSTLASLQTDKQDDWKVDLLFSSTGCTNYEDQASDLWVNCKVGW